MMLFPLRVITGGDSIGCFWTTTGHQQVQYQHYQRESWFKLFEVRVHKQHQFMMVYYLLYILYHINKASGNPHEIFLLPSSIKNGGIAMGFDYVAI
jgi:hypothetical protein